MEIVLLRRTNPIGNMVGENANRSKGEKQEISSKMWTVQKDGNKISDTRICIENNRVRFRGCKGSRFSSKSNHVRSRFDQYESSNGYNQLMETDDISDVVTPDKNKIR